MISCLLDRCVYGAIMLLLATGCSRTPVSEIPIDLKSNGIQFATGFSLSDTSIIVHEPWPGATTAQIYLLDKTPKKIVVTSTTHLPYLEMLGVEQALVGFPSTRYIYSSSFQSLVEEGQIQDLGPDGSLNLEILFDLSPDLVVAFDMGGESAMLDKITAAGIPVLYNSDFLEETVLGRAEWIKVFGALFQKQTLADSIFSQIVSNYDSLKAIVPANTQNPTVLSGIMYGDAWFLPGGKNGFAQLIADAGGQYFWADNEANGWLEYGFESVYEKANGADVWLGTATLMNKEELISQDQRYGAFAAFEQSEVYNYSKRVSPTGGFDYFESGYARPDLVLADLIIILHPKLKANKELYYFQRLN
ncbi:MAG: iron complex transport system substrate-binding protein [Cyclobacteriaceae bacterium]|jgi:iron complex transport system substrate-binding protein